VMTMRKFQAGYPAAIGCLAHGSRGWVPSVEITYQGHFLNAWGIAEKRNVMPLPAC
jgi:hypothetical protein